MAYLRRRGSEPESHAKPEASGRSVEAAPRILWSALFVKGVCAITAPGPGSALVGARKKCFARAISRTRFPWQPHLASLRFHRGLRLLDDVSRGIAHSAVGLRLSAVREIPSTRETSALKPIVYLAKAGSA